MTLVPEHIERLVPYVPGKPVEDLERELGIHGAVKLASNENPLGPSPLALAAAMAAAAGTNRYPDGGSFRLRGRLAERLGVSPDNVILGAGSSELVELMIRTFCRPGPDGDEVLTHRHAFFMYKVSAQAAGVTYRESAVTPDLRCDVDALAAAVTERTKVMFLPNPNNPTGAYVTRTELERLLARLPEHVLLVVDEAYYEYARAIPDYPVADAYRAQRPNLTWLRTFSKAYGLAGLRVGYGVTSPDIAAYVNRVRLPFNVPSVAQAAALAALDDTAHVERSVRVNAEGKAQLTAGLQKLGLRVFPSAANFVLVDVGRDAAPVYEALLRLGVIVRPLRPAGLMQHLRVSIGTAEENARALAAFAEVV
jgi:histidinol-phosphate aminotransferase